MSRDWTPKEMYLIEQMNIKKGMGSWFDWMENTTFSYKGVTKPLHSSEDIAKRKEFPLLGRLYDPFDKLYYFLSNVPTGLDLLGRMENELKNYIETGAGDKESALIRWFEGSLDEGFYYNTENNRLFFESVRDEVGRLYRNHPGLLQNCRWFPLTEDKCFSVWYAPDKYDGDQLQMKLEKRAEDGSMGAFCELIYDESYGTADLSYKAIAETLEEIYWDAGIHDVDANIIHNLTESVMDSFNLKKQSLSDKIQSAQFRTSVKSHHPDNSKTIHTPER